MKLNCPRKKKNSARENNLKKNVKKLNKYCQKTKYFWQKKNAYNIYKTCPAHVLYKKHHLGIEKKIVTFLIFFFVNALFFLFFYNFI